MAPGHPLADNARAQVLGFNHSSTPLLLEKPALPWPSFFPALASFALST
jgi:hypothetical protein